MSNENECHNETLLSVEIVTTPPRSLQPPIEYIDLTQDTPLSRRSQSSQNNSRTSLRTVGKRKVTSRRQQELVPDAVIDLNDTPEDQPVSMCCTNNSIRDESIRLQCPVCLEMLSSNLKPIATKCGHIFCEVCLQSIVRRVKKCPLCQARITLKSCVRLYF